jgi:biotin carboxylase
MKHIVVVGGKDSAASQLSCNGYEVSFIQEKSAFTALQKKISADAEIVDSLSEESVLDALRALQSRKPVDAVVSFFEECLLPTALAAHELGILSNPVRPVFLSRNKIEMRKHLSNSDVLSVKFRTCSSALDGIDFLKSTGGKAILKPAFGSGSRGVTFLNSASDVDTAWASLVHENALPALIEEYVEGPEFSIESLSVDGHHEILAVTEKVTSGAPHFVETGHQMPARLEEGVRRQIHETTQALLNHIGHRFGPAHTEVRIADRGPVVIETQTRFGGDQIWEMTALVTGCRLAEETVQALLGLPREPRLPQTSAAAIRFFTPEAGVIVDVDGVEAAQRSPGVLRVDDSRLVRGREVGVLGASWARCGYVLVCAHSTEDAVERAAHAASQVRWTLQKNSEERPRHP